ncbi:hypothetical protein C0992_008525, partial [Termitomyces sp. T32_za158]
WSGYESADDSWQPEENFRVGCESLLERFWQHVPFNKDDDFPPGFHIDADAKWIEREKKRFHQEEEQDSTTDVSEGDSGNGPSKKPEVAQKSQECTSELEEATQVAEMERVTAVNAKVSTVAPAGELPGGQTFNTEPSIPRTNRLIELPASFFERYLKPDWDNL